MELPEKGQYANCPMLHVSFSSAVEYRNNIALSWVIDEMKNVSSSPSVGVAPLVLLVPPCSLSKFSFCVLRSLRVENCILQSQDFLLSGNLCVLTRSNSMRLCQSSVSARYFRSRFFLLLEGRKKHQSQ